jgi:hypothetical protein
MTVVPQPEAEGSTWNLLASLGSGREGTVSFKVCFLFSVLLVVYTLLTVRLPLEEITQHQTLVGTILIFLIFKCCTFYLFNILLFLLAYFRTNTTGMTILQLHSVLLACVCGHKYSSANSGAFRDVTLRTELLI